MGRFNLTVFFTTLHFVRILVNLVNLSEKRSVNQLRYLGSPAERYFPVKVLIC